MCGRFTISASKEKIKELIPGVHIPEWREPNRNVRPTQEVAVVRNVEPREISYLRWGLVPHWAKDPKIGSQMINARAETVAEKPSFRKPLARQRCLILADGFFEWKDVPGATKRKPLRFRLAHGEPFAFAGLWDEWHPPEGPPLRTCTIITTSANDLVAPVHDRMPVILPPDAFDRWLNPEAAPADSLLPLLKPLAADLMMSDETQPG